ncbi:D-TA family PLP-dependent enzyme [Flavobacteriaceae sp. LMIT009]
MSDQAWYNIDDTESLITPALLVYPDRIEKNIKTMLAIAGDPDRLRPHIKTHKIAEIVNLQIKSGITKFKCATIAEAELLGLCEAKDVLLAMQPVGVNIDRFFKLTEDFPNSKFSAIVDCQEVIQKLGEIAKEKEVKVSLWLDINNGMNRTGVLPNEKASTLYKEVYEHSYLIAEGFHVYDGHIYESNFEKRKEICDEAFEPVLHLKDQIESLGMKVKTIVAGGTPTFPIHINRDNVEVCPGTSLLWDYGYARTYTDLKFLPAAVLLGQIVSKPKESHVCLNLGHKSLAAEMPFPRAKILNMENSQQVGHSEEHLVVECDDSNKYSIGDMCYVLPTHICPTVAKYESVLTVKEKKIKGSWVVAARDHKINI